MDIENEEGKKNTSKDRFCSKCGAKIEEGQKFCSKCGNKLGSIPKKIKLSIPKKIKTNKKVLIILGVVLFVVAIIIGNNISNSISDNRKEKIEKEYIKEAQTQYSKYDGYDEEMTKSELEEICAEHLKDSTELLGQYKVVNAGKKYNDGEILVYQIDKEDIEHIKKNSDYGKELIKLAVQRYICNRDTIFEDDWFYLALDYDSEDEEEDGYQFFISYENDGVIEVSDLVNEILINVNLD